MGEIYIVTMVRMGGYGSDDGIGVWWVRRGGGEGRKVGESGESQNIAEESGVKPKRGWRMAVTLHSLSDRWWDGGGGERAAPEVFINRLRVALSSEGVRRGTKK